jgi:hypothetical protein
MMRRGLVWALGATGVATLVTLWSGQQAPRIVAAVDRAMPAPLERPASPAAALRDPAPLAAALPSRLPALALEPARRDPFMPVPPPAPKPLPAPPTPPAAILPPPPPPLPSAPAVKARFLGRLVTPAGDSLVFLASADKTWLAQPGDALEDGYMVQAVTEQAVELVYPPLGVKVTVPLPPAPQP